MADSRVLHISAGASERCGGQQRQRETGRPPRLNRSRPETPVAELTAVAREFAMRSRQVQGLPDRITDPVALDQAARLVIAGQQRPVGEAARPP
jgi:hypothetical protein